MAGATGVDSKGGTGLGFGTVHITECRRVDHPLGSDVSNRFQDGFAVTDVEAGMVEPVNLMPRQHLLQVASELASGAGDQDPHALVRNGVGWQPPVVASVLAPLDGR